MEVLIVNRQQSSHNEWDSQQYKANQDVRVGRFFWEDDYRYVKLFHVDIFLTSMSNIKEIFIHTNLFKNKISKHIVTMGILMYSCDQKSRCFWSPSSSLAPRGALSFWTGLLNVSLIYPLQNQFCAKVEEFGGTTGHKRTPGNDALQLILLS